MIVIAVTGASIFSVDEKPEARSLLGKDLYRIEITGEDRTALEEKLQAAISEYESNVDDVEAFVWVGRRLAYLGRFRDSIAWYTKGLEKFGRNAKLLRHRGHRYISIRRFSNAVEDLEKAAELIAGQHDEIEPDGVPNSRNQPISSLHSNIWYHLALAHYLSGDYENALDACEKGIAIATNADRLISQTYWHYLTLRKLGRHAEAKRVLEPIHAKLDIIENHAYLRLLLVYKGESSAEEGVSKATSEIDEPTIAYGIAVFTMINGNQERAKQMYEKIISGTNWPAFGYIAAEAELSRMTR